MPLCAPSTAAEVWRWPRWPPTGTERAASRDTAAPNTHCLSIRTSPWFLPPRPGDCDTRGGGDVTKLGAGLGGPSRRPDGRKARGWSPHRSLCTGVRCGLHLKPVSRRPAELIYPKTVGKPVRGGSRSVRSGVLFAEIREPAGHLTTPCGRRPGRSNGLPPFLGFVHHAVTGRPWTSPRLHPGPLRRSAFCARSADDTARYPAGTLGRARTGDRATSDTWKARIWLHGLYLCP